MFQLTQIKSTSPQTIKYHISKFVQNHVFLKTIMIGVSYRATPPDFWKIKLYLIDYIQVMSKEKIFVYFDKFQRTDSNRYKLIRYSHLSHPKIQITHIKIWIIHLAISSSHFIAKLFHTSHYWKLLHFIIPTLCTDV